MPKSTVNNHLRRGLRQGALHRRGGFDATLGVGDVVAMPCWHAHTIEAPEDTVVFRVSDEPIFEKLGLARTATN